MPLRSLRSSTQAQALYRVFVQPSNTQFRAFTALSNPNITLALEPPHQIPNHHSVRRIYRYASAKPQSPPNLSDADHPLDEAIPGRLVHVVDAEEGTLSTPQLLQDVLRTFDRGNFVLRQVAVHQETQIPVCKVVSKLALREKANAQLKPKKDAAEASTKQIELSWVITDHDLAYRVKRIKEFLMQGKRVEVLMANKKAGRKATREEAEALLHKLRQELAAVEGVKEWKEMEGTLMREAILFFKPDGKLLKEKKGNMTETEGEENSQNEDKNIKKLRKKEEEKAERKALAERRQKAKDQLDVERGRIKVL